MSYKSILVLSLVLSSVRMSFSQGSSTTMPFEPQHLLTFSSGISAHTVRDEMMSPLLYRGTQAPLAFSYRFRGRENRHTLLLSYDYTQLHSTITRTVNDAAVSHYINNVHLNLEYSFSTRAAVFENINTTCFVGGRLSSILNLRTHVFLQDKNHMSAEQMTGLGIHVLTETALQQESPNLLRVEVNIPCISYVLLANRYNANVSEKLDNIDLEQNLLWQLFKSFRVLLIGYVWGLYLIVITTHLGNLLGYRAARRGLHGKLYLHQRTGYIIQMGRYVALAIFLIVLAICSASMFMLGVAIAGVSSAARQLAGMRKTPAIDPVADQTPFGIDGGYGVTCMP